MLYPIRIPFSSLGFVQIKSKCVEPLALTSNCAGGPGSEKKYYKWKKLQENNCSTLHYAGKHYKPTSR